MYASAALATASIVLSLSSSLSSSINATTPRFSAFGLFIRHRMSNWSIIFSRTIPLSLLSPHLMPPVSEIEPLGNLSDFRLMSTF